MPRKKLTPCAICDTRGKLWETYDGKFCVQCSHCGVSRTTKYFYTPEEAKQAWNDWNEPKGENNS